MATNGLTTIPSEFGAKPTMDRLEAEVKAKGMAIIARIGTRVDHGVAAPTGGAMFPPTETLIFASPRIGAPLTRDEKASAIDLPLKALVHEDEAGKVWLSYDDPRWMARRGLGAVVTANAEMISATLGAMAIKATKSP